MGKQPAVLSASRRTVVLTVLWTVFGQRLPNRISHNADALVLHPHGTQRDFLKRVGHHTQRVEGLFAENHCCAHLWHRGSGHLMFPAAADLEVISHFSPLTSNN